MIQIITTIIITTIIIIITTDIIDTLIITILSALCTRAREEGSSGFEARLEFHTPLFLVINLVAMVMILTMIVVVMMVVVVIRAGCGEKKYMICSTNLKTTTGLPQHVSHLILSSFIQPGLIFEIETGVKNQSKR